MIGSSILPAVGPSVFSAAVVTACAVSAFAFSASAAAFLASVISLTFLKSIVPPLVTSAIPSMLILPSPTATMAPIFSPAFSPVAVSDLRAEKRALSAINCRVSRTSLRARSSFVRPSWPIYMLDIDTRRSNISARIPVGLPSAFAFSSGRLISSILSPHCFKTSAKISWSISYRRRRPSRGAGAIRADGVPCAWPRTPRSTRFTLGFSDLRS